MAEIVNLRQARKVRQRAAASNKAKAERARTGLTRSEREAQRLEAERQAQVLDRAKLEPERPD